MVSMLLPPRRLTLILVLLALTDPAAPGPANGSARSGFYSRGSEGWFWYQREPSPPPEPEVILPPPPPPPVPAPEPEKEPAVPDGPAPLSAAWLRANLQDYLDAATDDPTPENVSVYFHLQRLAMDKSSRFADMSQRVVMQDPGLDEITQRPTAPFATHKVDRTAGEKRDAMLEHLAADTGVLFFFKSDCPYCEAQAPILEMLHRRFGFAIQPVSIDGGPLPGGLFPQFRADRGQAERLGVVSTPAMFLMRPPDAMTPIGQGMLSLTQLEDRILMAAVNAGFIRENQFETTRPRTAHLPTDTQLPSHLPKDPAELLALLRQMSAARANVPTQPTERP